VAPFVERSSSAWYEFLKEPYAVLHSTATLGHDRIIGFSGLYVGRWEVALIGGLVALLLGVVFKGVYSRYMRSLGAESA
jgi:hypothetical protein